MNSTNEMPNDIRFLCEWTHDFDKLLSDKLAIKLFAQFLKKEYSYENLKFWLSCKKYQKITDRLKRTEYARYVYERYLRPGAEQAVNVDNRALIAVESRLEDPKQDLFDVPERQIYELMKTDCYKRFLKSFYSNGNNENAFHEQVFQSFSENQSQNERYRKNAYRKLRRQELHEINRKIAKRKLERNMSPKNKISLNRQKDNKMCTPLRNGSECHPIKCQRMQTSTLFESIQWIQSNMSASKQKKDISDQLEPKNNSFIIVFPNGSQERLEVHKSETIRQLLERVLRKRNLNYTSFEAFPMGSEKELDLNTDVMNLNCSRIRVEQRVIFDIQLPNGLIVNVKSKPTTISAKVLNPILIEFNRKYDPEYYEIRFTDTWERLAPDLPIFCADNRKLVVVYQGINETKSISDNSSSIMEREKMFLSQFLGNESKSLGMNAKNKEFLNISDISFNDDFKSEEFFNDLMKCSQTVPKDKDIKQSTDSPNIHSKESKKFSKNQSILENIMFLSEKSTEKPNPKKSNLKNKFKINSPKLKSIIDFNKKSPPNLKSDQLYDKRIVRRTHKIVEEVNRKDINHTKCRELSCKTRSPLSSTEPLAHNSIKTLSKFHKTSREKLQSEMETKIPVPEGFGLNQ